MQIQASNTNQQEKNLIFRQVVHQRYVQSLRDFLKQNKISFVQIQNGLSIKESKNNNDASTIFQISLSEAVLSNQNKSYFTLLKTFHQLRKAINPELTFEQFLAQYNNELKEKFVRYSIDHLFKGLQLSKPIPSYKLNSLMISNEFQFSKDQTLELVKSKKDQIQQVTKQLHEVNQQYESLVGQLIERNTSLNVQNLEYQFRLKQNEIMMKQKATKIFVSSKSNSKMQKTLPRKGLKQQSHKFSHQNEKKQQVQRIKMVVGNNMWGWGDKIHQRLKKLNEIQLQLKEEQSV